jgi:hypothetical protein
VRGETRFLISQPEESTIVRAKYEFANRARASFLDKDLSFVPVFMDGDASFSSGKIAGKAQGKAFT